MAIQPGKTKFRKAQRRRVRGWASVGASLAFGEYGLQSLDSGWLSVRQIEAARRALTHYVKRGGKIWIRLLADHPVSSRPAETRMGGGKGAPEFFVARIRRGTVLFELAGVSRSDAQEAMRLAGHKLSMATQFIQKEVVQ